MRTLSLAILQSWSTRVEQRKMMRSIIHSTWLTKGRVEYLCEVAQCLIVIISESRGGAGPLEKGLIYYFLAGWIHTSCTLNGNNPEKRKCRGTHA